MASQGGAATEGHKILVINTGESHWWTAQLTWSFFHTSTSLGRCEHPKAPCLINGPSLLPKGSKLNQIIHKNLNLTLNFLYDMSLKIKIQLKLINMKYIIEIWINHHLSPHQWQHPIWSINILTITCFVTHYSTNFCSFVFASLFKIINYSLLQ